MSSRAELVVVGDADQSIYAFRGATIRNIVEFEQDYPNARTILLEQNYRSTQTILRAANAVIARNAGRRKKNLWTDSGDGARIVGYVADNEHDEASFVAREIDRLGDEHGVRPGDVAVFYRTNAQSRAVEEVFVRVGLPYKVVGGTRFYERREVKDALAYLRVISNPTDTVNLRRILNMPKRGIGDRAEACVGALAERERIPFVAALGRAEDAPGIATRSVAAITAFTSLLEELGRVARGGRRRGRAARGGGRATGYLAELRASHDPQDETRIENLAELVAVAREFDEAAARPRGDRLEDFLEQVSLVADADEIPDREAAARVVTLMTLHTAKGLEFPVVFLTGMEDGTFPHMRASATPRSSRRSAGWPTWASPAPGSGSTSPGRRCARRGALRSTTRRRASSTRSRPSWSTGSARSPVPRVRPSDQRPAVATLRPRARGALARQPSGHLAAPGDRVTHDSFGLGTVVGPGEGDEPGATSTSARSRAQALLLRYAPLVKL